MKQLISVKTSALFAFFFVISGFLSSQNYTWMKGTNTVDQQGTYGQIGIPAAANNPGSRDGACTWKDAAGNLWLFGGMGYDSFGNYSYLNDLWKYTIATNQWTWIGGDNIVDQNGIYGTVGVPAAANKPGSRTMTVSWTDAAGNFWLFGGDGWDAFSNQGPLNDLWKYNPLTNQWTWIRGSNSSPAVASYGTINIAANTNEPGPRFVPNGWADASGNLFLFGGIGSDATFNFGDLNDLWKYNIASNQWTWIKGSNLTDQNGTYGTMGVAAATNQPGGRYASQNWKDLSGNIWFQGGYGYDASSGIDDFLNDVWKYDPVSNQWTWIMGSTSSVQLGTYGTLGVPAPGNIPGSRAGGLSWTDASGEFYMFGGTGYLSSTAATDDLNDLWKFSPSTNQWSWLKGSNIQGQNGTYGTQGVTSPANTPGSRLLSAGWIDNSDNIWIFGGTGIPANSLGYGDLDDLWKLTNCTAPVLTISSNSVSICAGQSNTLTAGGASTYSWSTSQSSASITVNPLVTTTYSVVGTSAAGCSSSLSFTQTVTPGPTLSIALSTSTNGALCSGQPGTLIASGSGIVTYSWSTGVVSSSIVVAPATMTNFVSYGSDANGCVGSSTLTIPVFQNPTLTISSTRSVICKGESVTIQAGNAITYTWSTATPVISNLIQVSPLVSTTYSVTGEDATGCKGTASILQTVEMCTGIEAANFNGTNLSLYPNPNNGSFNLSGITSGENLSFIVYNTIGQKVFEHNDLSEKTKMETGLPKGIYHYRLVQNNKTISLGKILVE